MAHYAEYFMDVHKGKIVGLCEAHPAHELNPWQVAITKEEYYILRSVHCDLEYLDKIIETLKWKTTQVTGSIDDTSK